MKKFALVFNLFILSLFCISCSPYFWNPVGATGAEVKQRLDPLLGLEMDTVTTYISKISRMTLMLHEETVNPNYSEFSWSKQRPFFYPKDTVKSVLAEKGIYDILIYNINIREVDKQRGFSGYGLTEEQMRILDEKLGTVILFERIQLTFRDGKLIHWCWQCVL